jgi:2,3-bisphosphoglycerate-dependent phosphoglycerate mutase
MGIIILLRHGQSQWNLANLFTGWVDILLSHQGIKEAQDAGKKLQTLPPIDIVFTSCLIRAQMTASIALLEGSQKEPFFVHEEEPMKSKSRLYGTREQALPMFISPALNERCYGELQGLNKDEVRARFGAEQVQKWRRSFHEVPPGGESLAMTKARTLPYFYENILPKVRENKTVLVVAHGNSLRSIIMEIEKLSEEEILHRELATGEMVIYHDRDIV